AHRCTRMHIFEPFSTVPSRPMHIPAHRSLCAEPRSHFISITHADDYPRKSSFPPFHNLLRSTAGTIPFQQVTHMSVIKQSMLLLVAAATWAGAAPMPTTTDNAVREAPRRELPKESGVGRLVPDIEFTAVDGKKFRLSEFKGAPAIVIAFT